MYYRTRTKFCGMTRIEDIDTAVQLGVDALGFILYPKSKRALAFEEAQALVAAVPAWVSSVVLLVNATAVEVERVIREIKPSYLQFHGDETADFCEQFNYPYLRAVRVGGPSTATAEAVASYVADYDSAAAFIFDAYSPDFGGAGITFDLELLSQVKRQLPPEKIIIAGGLDPDNIKSLVKSQRPFGVDLCSSIERVAGEKDPQSMHRFMQALTEAAEF